MRARVIVIAGSVAAVATGGIVAATIMAASGTTAAAKTTVAEPAVVSSPSAPTWDVAPSAVATSPSATATPHSSAAATKAATGTITYVVKPGDNLSVISAWFHLHGYGALYDANRAVIGSDPDLIFPGQRITISGGRLTMSSK